MSISKQTSDTNTVKTGWVMCWLCKLIFTDKAPAETASIRQTDGFPESA
jgi:hypothetical protein